MSYILDALKNKQYFFWKCARCSKVNYDNKEQVCCWNCCQCHDIHFLNEQEQLYRIEHLDLVCPYCLTLTIALSNKCETCGYDFNKNIYSIIKQEKLMKDKQFSDEYPAPNIESKKSFSDVCDSGDRRKFSTGAQRDMAEGKGRYDLIPGIALERLAQHYENGARKYDPDNWRKGIPLDCYLDSAMRHLTKLIQEFKGDRECDEDHAAAIMWNIAGYIWTLNEIQNNRLPQEYGSNKHSQ